MTLPSTGSISFSQIQGEFGLPPSKNLGAYRISQSVGSLDNLPLDTGIPQSGSISFSNFRGKKLNIVVDYHSPGIEGSHRSGNYKIEYNARGRYNENGVAVIGGFRTRPSNSSGTKVYVNVNRTIGSEISNDSTRVALRTGGWDEGTELIIVIGPSGGLYGAGGDGGYGGSASLAYNVNRNGGGGGNGTSALGIEYNGTRIINYGVIRRGFGGGGGGAGVTGYGGRYDGLYLTCGGGGGAGGSGYPAGSGGAGAGGSYKGWFDGYPGTNGSITSSGEGGRMGPQAYPGAEPYGYWVNSLRMYIRGGFGGGGEQAGGISNVNGKKYFLPYPPYTETIINDPNKGGAAGGVGYALVVSPGVSYTLEGNPLNGGVLTANPT